MHTYNPMPWAMVTHTSLTELLTLFPSGNTQDGEFSKYSPEIKELPKKERFWVLAFRVSKMWRPVPISHQHWQVPTRWKVNCKMKLLNSLTQRRIDVDTSLLWFNRRLVLHKSLPRLHFHGYKQVTSLLNFLMQTLFSGITGDLGNEQASEHRTSLGGWYRNWRGTWGTSEWRTSSRRVCPSAGIQISLIN